MWTNIIGWVAVLTINLTVASVMFGYLMNRMSHYEEELKRKTGTEMCDQRYNEMKSDMTRGETAFTEIRDELKIQGKLLERVDATVKMILDNLPKERHDN